METERLKDTPSGNSGPPPADDEWNLEGEEIGVGDVKCVYVLLCSCRCMSLIFVLKIQISR